MSGRLWTQLTHRLLILFVSAVCIAIIAVLSAHYLPPLPQHTHSPAARRFVFSSTTAAATTAAAVSAASSASTPVANMSSSADASSGAARAPETFFDLQAVDAKKQPVDFSAYKGKVVLVVNVASKCGFTPQYKGLEELYKKHKDQGLVILGFPCNGFGSQEPAPEDEIVSFCSNTYGVSFPIMSKIEVNGANEHPVYNFLKSKKSGMLGLTRIKWNFEKFLVDKQGQVVERYSSLTKPEELEAKIVELLNK